MTLDPTLALFLEAQCRDGLALAAQSDLLDLHPLDPQRFVAVFHCKGIVRDDLAEPREHDEFAVGIRFGESHLRSVNPAEILTWIAPDNIHHPNIRPPYLCVGSITPGTTLVELIYRCFDLIVFDNVMPREDHCLNREACSWARRHRDRFPLDDRPFKWRATDAAPAGQVQR